MLSATIAGQVGSFRLEAAFDTSPDEIVAVVGPNGAGKSTLLKTLAGLHSLQSGRVVVDGEVWEDTSIGLRVAPEARSVGYVPQSGLLFPHLTVLQNTAFGVDDDTARATALLGRLDLQHLAGKAPQALSGGQVQLVAFARALVRDPRVLLLDEPLASVDVANRAAIRRMIRRELRAQPGHRLIVTHDPLEAAALADRIVVLDDGRITQTGSLDDLRTRPASSYVAELVGMNFFRGRADSGLIELVGGEKLVSATDLSGPVIATVHPRAVALYTERPTGSPRNVWRCMVGAVEPSLDQVRVHVTGPIDLIAEVTRAGAAPFPEGQPVWVSVKASEVGTNPA